MKEKLWTKNFTAITTISFVIFFVFYILLILLPIYITEQLHANADQAGLLVTTFLIAGIITRPIAGHWVGKYSNKKILVISSLFFAAITMLYPFFHSITSLLAVRILHGFSFGVITTVKGTISARLIPTSRRGEGISFFSLAMGLAMVVGPFIGINMARFHYFGPAFILCIVAAVVGIALSLMIKVNEHHISHPATHKKEGIAGLFDRKALPFAFIAFLMTFAYSGISAFLSLYAREINLMSAASNFLLCYAAFLMFCRLFTGNICDKHGAGFVVYPCMLIFVAGLIVLGWTSTSFMMVIAGALIGIGYGSVTPIIQTQIINSVEHHKVGVANSLFFNAMDLGLAVGALIFGLIIGHLGYRVIYYTGAVLVLISMLYYFLYVKRSAQSVICQTGMLIEEKE
ncbi:MAG TPA: MFS transporter [Scandinavium sp.]|jgi:predicted MFS family arabinose efflux permease|uniref:MFS transporter n=1 Tax=Scandinavium sp. TaxID=2830653 RepID=UPI002E3040E4|nr:MFS transporter [Scandinavium sp.]HEX4500043.1 MFS transporter [Scandinavium sp.]